MIEEKIHRTFDNQTIGNDNNMLEIKTHNIIKHFSLQDGRMLSFKLAIDGKFIIEEKRCGLDKKCNN